MINSFRVNSETLHEERDWLLVTLSSIGDGVLATDFDGRVTFLNPVAESLTGWTKSEALGQHLHTVFRIINEEDRLPVESPSVQAFRENRIVQLATHSLLISKDGTERPLDDSASPIRDEKGDVTGVVLVFRDITERRKVERARDEATAYANDLIATLRETDRHKDEFLATLAHELRNPLAPIRNAVHYLGVDGITEQDIKTARDIIARQVTVMVRLIDDLLDVSRISRNKLDMQKENVALTAVVEMSLESSRAFIERSGIELTVTLPREPIILNADPVRLSQVFSNLLNNAAKYTNRGGHVWLTAEAKGSDAVVIVRDNGIGIPTPMLNSIFELFTQVDRSSVHSQGGLGIGLTLVRRLVNLHEGSIEACSDGPGCGSEFIVRLPITRSLTATLAKKDEPEVPRVNRGRILIVDDNKDSAESLEMLLRLRGNDTRVAYDGIEALEVANSFQPALVLLDIGLPKMNGYDVARQIRQQAWSRDVTLVAVTGWGQEEDKRRSKEAGFNLHVVKPLDFKVLEGLLSAVRTSPDVSR